MNEKTSRPSPRMATVDHLLHSLREARRGESEVLMKEVWENCDRAQLAEADAELDVVIALLEERKRQLSR